MTTDKQSTAMRQLIEYAKKWHDYINDNDSSEDKHAKMAYKDIIDKATELLEVERKQIEDAYNQDLYGGLDGFQKFTDGSDYFTTTFKQQ